MMRACALALVLGFTTGCPAEVTGDDPPPDELGLVETAAMFTDMGSFRVTPDGTRMLGIAATSRPRIAQLDIDGTGKLAILAQAELLAMRYEVDDHYLFVMTDRDVARYRTYPDGAAPILIATSTVGAGVLSFGEDHVFAANGTELRMFDRTTYLTRDTSEADLIASWSLPQGFSAGKITEKDGVVYVGTNAHGVLAYDLAMPDDPKLFLWLGAWIGTTIVRDDDRLIIQDGYDTVIYSIANARSPSEIARMEGGGSDSYVHGGKLYGVDRRGFQVIDLAGPRLIGRYDIGECHSIRVTTQAVFVGCTPGLVQRFEAN